VVKVTLNHSGSTYILVVYGSNHADVSAVSKLVAGGPATSEAGARRPRSSTNYSDLLH
jgi:hypothetical protein